MTKNIYEIRDDSRRAVDEAVAKFCQTLPAYKALQHAEELIAFLEGRANHRVRTDSSGVINSKNKPAVLTTPELKEEILSAVKSTLMKSENRSNTVQELFSICKESGINIPGKSPISTLTALISQRKKIFERVGNGKYRLLDE